MDGVNTTALSLKESAELRRQKIGISSSSPISWPR